MRGTHADSFSVVHFVFFVRANLLMKHYLDGTVNYYYGIPHFCVSIALRRKAEIIVGTIYDPIRDELWIGQKGATPKLNGRELRVSERADLAEAVVSVGLSKTGVTIEAGIPLLQTMVH